jgi:Tol biopolymer transport system component
MKTGVTEPILPTDGVDLDLSGSSRYVAVVISGNVDVYDRYTRTIDSNTGSGSTPSISDNGRYLTFTRPSAGLDDPRAIFVRDRVAGTTTQVPFSAPSTNYPDFTSASNPQISGNGRYVAFTERELLDLQPPDTFDYRYRIYVYDRQAGTLERADVRFDGTPGDGQTGEVHAISDDGRDVMFRSGELVANETFGDHEYVRDRVAHNTYLVDRNQNEQIANGYSGYGSDISGDGNRVALSSQATNLVPNDTNNAIDVFVRSFPGAPPP